MSRAGRKRKDVARKGGRIDWREQHEAPAVLAAWHRGRDNFLAFGGDPMFASQAGKLFAYRALDAAQVEAAKRWCLMLQVYDRVVLGLVRELHGTAMDRVGASLALERDPEWIAAFRERFEEVQGVILTTSGKSGLTALNRLCRDEAASSVLSEARKSLNALVAHFHIAPRNGA